MRNLKSATLLPFLLLAMPLSVTAETTSCFPKSKLYIDASIKSANLSEFAFNQTVDRFMHTMGPIIKQRFRKKLIINREWDNGRVNAHATRDDDNNPVIGISGGMARHPHMTKDGLMLILCHELGHQFGGAPKQFRGRSTRRSWSSAEGQADYFAVTKCLPKLFHDNSKTRIYERDYQPDDLIEAKNACQNDDCVRSVLAGLTVGRLFASLKTDGEMPTIQSEDSTVVLQTNYQHAKPQCRVDTFIAGANCTANSNIDFDPILPKIGACNRPDHEGARPQCWYLPQDSYK